MELSFPVELFLHFKVDMKIHRVIVDQLIQALQEILFQKKQADKVIERFFKANKKWGSRDRKFFAESAYEIVRWYKKYLYLYHPRCADTDQELFAHQETLLLWKIWGSYFLQKYNSLPDWPELREVVSVSDEKWNSAPRAVRESIPLWLDELGEQEFAQEWDEILASLNQPADVFIRVNELRTDREKLHHQLKEMNIPTELVRGVDSALRLKERRNVFSSDAFKQGLFEVQDAASQMIAPMMDLVPGQRVIDACAGAGGKSLHIATVMRNKGKVLALDIFEWKLNELKTRARRQKIDIIETRWIENSKVTKRLQDSCDRLLLDVPCSGLGVLKRNPDKKWKTSFDEIQRLRDLQREILTNYSKFLKVGGLMVYATCSVLHSENDKQVEWFLKNNPQFELKRELHVWPQQTGFDGFYAAVLIRNKVST